MRKSKEPDKLAKDVSKAIAARMSYGKWKATQEIVIPEKKPIGDMGICKYCGKPMDKGRYNNRGYCDFVCKYNAAKDRERQRKAKLVQGI